MGIVEGVPDGIFPPSSKVASLVASILSIDEERHGVR
jgi:hypothetical protein